MSAKTDSTSVSPPDPSNDSTISRPLRLVRLPEVCRVTGFQKSKLYAMIAAGTFPRFLKIANCRASLWDAAAVERWVADVIKQGGVQ
jgi:prophage regulatory protein